MKKYLYLLPFKSGEIFKVGISQGNNDRILRHDLSYGVDFDKSLIITFNSGSMVRAAETEILNTFPASTGEHGHADGYTEIRDMSYFNECVCILKSKHANLGVAIHTYNNYFPKHIDQRSKIKKQTNADQSTCQKRPIRGWGKLNAKSILDFKYSWNLYLDNGIIKGVYCTTPGGDCIVELCKSAHPAALHLHFELNIIPSKHQPTPTVLGLMKLYSVKKNLSEFKTGTLGRISFRENCIYELRGLFRKELGADEMAPNADKQPPICKHIRDQLDDMQKTVSDFKKFKI